MKTWAIAALLCARAAAQSPPADAACGPKQQAFQVIKDRSQHPTPTPSAGKALVYFFGHGMFAVDGKTLGAVTNSYGLVEVDPGEHHFCGWMTGTFGPLKMYAPSLHSLTAEPGRSYYFEMVDRLYYPFTLELLDPDEGRYQISRQPFSTSRPK